ncbi:MAG: methyl-accepting chemotaxis protein, partial [Acutalibacteraceae bacterium]
QTAQIIHDAVEDISAVIKDIGNVEQSSDQQTDAINQIREGLSQISSVVQTNAATSEENSAASEEMSSQAMALRDEVAKFKLKEDTQHNMYINLDEETHEYSKEKEDDNFDISMF